MLVDDWFIIFNYGFSWIVEIDLFVFYFIFSVVVVFTIAVFVSEIKILFIWILNHSFDIDIHRMKVCFWIHCGVAMAVLKSEESGLVLFLAQLVHSFDYLYWHW